MVSFFEEDIKYNLKDKAKVKNWIKEVATIYNKKVGELNYIFCSDEYLLEINKNYLNHDYYTDIITFDQSESEEKIEGEIYISIERVTENANTNKALFRDELNRVMIHGVLHLLGFKDKTAAESETMRELEDKMIEKYKII